MEIKLSNQQHIQYARTDDALKAFYSAINNGQARLAMEMLTDIIAGLVNEIDLLKSGENPTLIEEVTPTPATGENVGSDEDLITYSEPEVEAPVEEVEAPVEEVEATANKPVAKKVSATKKSSEKASTAD